LSKELKVGIVGLGWVGRCQVQTVEQIEGASVVAAAEKAP